jgi:type IV pilus assembly protein PilE
MVVKRKILYRMSSGFTLIELMIVTAVIGILAAIAYPNYTDKVRKSRRADAQSALMSIAALQQQFLLDTRGYAADLATLNYTTPAAVANYYTVAISPAPVPAPVVPTFTVTAQPTGGQASDTCATLSINANGVKTPATCW